MAKFGKLCQFVYKIIFIIKYQVMESLYFLAIQINFLGFAGFNLLKLHPWYVL